MILPIFINHIDEAKQQLKELGVEVKDEVTISVAQLYFRDEEILGFWVNSICSEIVIYTSVQSFIGPYSKELEEQLKIAIIL